MQLDKLISTIFLWIATVILTFSFYILGSNEGDVVTAAVFMLIPLYITTIVATFAALIRSEEMGKYSILFTLLGMFAAFWLYSGNNFDENLWILIPFTVYLISVIIACLTAYEAFGVTEYNEQLPWLDDSSYYSDPYESTGPGSYPVDRELEAVLAGTSPGVEIFAKKGFLPTETIHLWSQFPSDRKKKVRAWEVLPACYNNNRGIKEFESYGFRIEYILVCYKKVETRYVTKHDQYKGTLEFRDDDYRTHTAVLRGDVTETEKHEIDWTDVYSNLDSACSAAMAASRTSADELAYVCVHMTQSQDIIYAAYHNGILI